MTTLVLPNRDLLDPNFESYKLSLNPTSVFSAFESNEIDLKSLKPTTFSRFEIQLYSIHNALFQDRFSQQAVYYFTKDGQVKCVVIPDRKEIFSCGKTVYQVPSWTETSENESHCNASMQFTKDFVTVCDGSCNFFILSSPDRFHNPLATWKMVLQVKLPLTIPYAYLTDALQSQTHDGAQQIDCLFISMENDSETSRTTIMNIDWLTFTEISDTWSLTRNRRLTSTSFPEYVCFDHNASSISICSSCPFTAVSDSANPNVKPYCSPINVPKFEDQDIPEPVAETVATRFVWSQSSDSSGDAIVNILVKVDSDKPKPHINIECTSAGALKVEVDDVVLLDSKLFALIRPADTLWVYDPKVTSIDITIVKRDPDVWPRLLFDAEEEDCLGVSCDESAVTLSGDNANEAPINNFQQNVFNVDQLEDVDMVKESDDTDLMLQRISGDNMQCVLKAEMQDFQWLYNATSPGGGCSKLLCTRHDVDGLVWGPDTEGGEGSRGWRHLATLQAFGYVLASKRNHRFVASPPTELNADASKIPFVAVADTARQIYVYWQPGQGAQGSSKLTELRKRGSTGCSKVVHVAWQQVISLPEADEIIGFVATTRPSASCLVVTRTNLYLVSLEE